MCGIAGRLAAPHSSREQLNTLSKQMAAALKHRGPDDNGVWCDETAGIALSHARLSVIDLSVHGKQPMESADGRYFLVFNGEIYNHEALRHKLQNSSAPPNFRGTSDTEVFLESISTWGIQESIQQSNGMFAFALWDRGEKALTLSRDRLGEKPLYYGWHQDGFIFASELKAFAVLPRWPPRIDKNALELFTKYSCVPAPWSIFQGIYKLPPGSTIIVDLKRIQNRSAFSPVADAPGHWGPKTYWSAQKAATTGRDNPFHGEKKEGEARLLELFRDSVKLRMTADVPLGAFLSGGIDSSLVTALMQEQSSRPIKTFTIGFHEESYDEAQDAKRVAQHLKTDHTELYASPSDARDVIPKLPDIYDEPFADSSQIPTYLVSALARKQVTVVLSGDGGDESFAGYTRHVWGERIWPKVSRYPLPLRKIAASFINSVSPDHWDKISPLFGKKLEAYGNNGRVGEKLHKVAEVLQMSDCPAFYERLVSLWPASPLVGDKTEATHPWSATALANGASPAEQMMLFDQTGYLPDDILVKVDRASMAHSLEGRMPFLDHRLVEFAWTLPLEWKVSASGGKIILKNLLGRYLPNELFNRPKMGFGVPIDAWLRGPLKDWAEELLSERRLREDGFFDAKTVRAHWADHLSGRYNYPGPLWTILMFQAWQAKSKSASA